MISRAAIFLSGMIMLSTLPSCGDGADNCDGLFGMWDGQGTCENDDGKQLANRGYMYLDGKGNVIYIDIEWGLFPQQCSYDSDIMYCQGHGTYSCLGRKFHMTIQYSDCQISLYNAAGCDHKAAMAVQPTQDTFDGAFGACIVGSVRGCRFSFCHEPIL